MAEKEESFIIQCQYKLEIEELQKEILSLKKHGVLDKVEDNDGAEDPDQHEETPKQFEETSAKNLFKCEIIDQKLTVTAFWGDGKDADLPQSIDGVPLKVIGDGAFKGAVISSISIPDGIEEIGWFAFSGCKTLKSITIPSSVTAIGYGAFEYCSSDLTIICEDGSYAEAYAKSWGINVVIE